MNDLKILILVLVGSLLMNQFTAYLRIPTVVGQLVAGIILGPAVLNWVHFNNLIGSFFYLGVILLMFLAGLESDLQLLKRYLGPSLLVATCGVALPMLVMPLIGHGIGLPLSQNLFLGVTFAATSVSITVEVLKEMKLLRSRAGTTILGASVADDVMAIVLLSLVSIVAHQNLGQTIVSSQHFGELLGLQIIYFGLLYIIVCWGAPKFFQMLPHLAGKYDVVILSLILCFGLAYLAELVGLSGITGSFFAGIAISETHLKESVQVPVDALGKLLFIPVFFISIGLKMTLSGIVDHWGLLIALTIAAVLTKFFGAGLGGFLAGFKRHSAALIGSGMVSRGEVALIIAQIGLVGHLITPNLYSTIIAAIIITTCLAPLLLKTCVKDA